MTEHRMGEMLAEPNSRSFVPPESLSWCISATSLEAWHEEGIVLTKAHRMKVKGSFHVPRCGAQTDHHISRCEPAPQGWPQCKRCLKKDSVVIPPAFRVAWL